jgi:hypothetical protein
MGQPITVVEKASSNPAMLRFETNRPLSGMGHERYLEPPDPLLRRPVDEIARRLFAAGGVTAVHINGSMITVTLGPGRTGEGLGDIVRSLFIHYGPAATEPTETDSTTSGAGATGADTPQGTTETAAEPALVEDQDTVGPVEGRAAEVAAREAAVADPAADETPPIESTPSGATASRVVAADADPPAGEDPS